MADSPSPTIDAVLERLNRLAEQFSAFEARVHAEIAELRAQMIGEAAATRAATEQRLDEIERLTGKTRRDLHDLRAELRDALAPAKPPA